LPAQVGIEPVVKHYRGKDPRAFVIRANIARRHLTTEERADLAAKLAVATANRQPRSRGQMAL
jgi:hypothetical protein